MNESPIVFRCCECTVEELSLEHLESHIWSRHIQKFPFNCALCNYPAMNFNSLASHFRNQHPGVQEIEFKRKLEDEKRIRAMIAESIAIHLLESDSEDGREESVYFPQNESCDVGTNCGQLMDDNADIIQIEDLNLVDRNLTPIVVLPTNCQEYKDLVTNSHYELIEEDIINGNDEEETGEIEFVDEDGNPVYIRHCEDVSTTDEQIEDFESLSDSNVQLLRSQRLEKTVNNVALGDDIACSSQSEMFSMASGKLRKKSPQNRKYACDVCGKTIKYLSKMLEHKRTHDGDRPFACAYCSARFTQNGALKCHMRLHTGEKPYPCTWECGKSFVSTSARALHEKNHSGERSFLCSLCGKSFSKSSHCNRHVKNVHARNIALGVPSLSVGLEVSVNDSNCIRELVNSVIDGVREDRNARERESVALKAKAEVACEPE